MAVNALEAMLFDTKDKLTQDEFIACSTEAERETISAKLSQVTDWLDEADVTIETKEYNEQLKTLKKSCKDVFYRLDERKLRPKKLDELKEVFNKSMNFLETIRNMTGGEDKPLTQVQFDTFDKLIGTTKDWEVKMLDEQSKLAENESPKLTSADINDKIEALRREVGYLVTKIKYFRPPTKKTPLKKDEEKVKTAKKSNESEKTTDSEKTSDESPKDDTNADEEGKATEKPESTEESTTEEPVSTEESTTEETKKSETTDNPEL